MCSMADYMTCQSDLYKRGGIGALENAHELTREPSSAVDVSPCKASFCYVFRLISLPIVSLLVVFSFFSA